MLPPVPQPARFIDPLSDFGFKRLFGSEPNKEILIDFLNQLFKDQAVPKVIRDLTYHSTEKYGEDDQSKKVVFDLLCTCDNGEQILVGNLPLRLTVRKYTKAATSKDSGRYYPVRSAWELGEDWNVKCILQKNKLLNFPR